LGAVGLPATSGTAQTGIARFSQSGGVGVVDFGFGGGAGFGWIQAVDSTNLATNFGLLLNPNGGNVGIGTTAPDQKLSVQGDADKSAGGTSWGVFSDERLKDIKGSYSRGLSAVMGLQPVRFSYKKDNALKLQTDSENIGFSAQALQKLVPEAVTKSPSGYLVVHSDAVLWAMLNAIKEQQAEIQQLKGQIQKLRTVHRRRHR
jgi:endosialidase-like protein